MPRRRCGALLPQGRRSGRRRWGSSRTRRCCGAGSTTGARRRRSAAARATSTACSANAGSARMRAGGQRRHGQADPPTCTRGPIHYSHGFVRACATDPPRPRLQLPAALKITHCDVWSIMQLSSCSPLSILILAPVDCHPFDPRADVHVRCAWPSSRVACRSRTACSTSSARAAAAAHASAPSSGRRFSASASSRRRRSQPCGAGRP